MEQLITFTQAERNEVVRVYSDPDAAGSIEAKANYKLRQQIQEFARVLTVALEHPDDEDCQSLLRAVRAIMA